MPTNVGLQKNETDVIVQAVALELDCVGAYTEAASAVKDATASAQFTAMVADCARHVATWQARLGTLGHAPATRNALTEPLNRFKVKAAKPFGLSCVARVVRNNSADTITGYTRVAHRADLQGATRAIAEAFLPEAAKHAQWVEQLLKGGTPAHAHGGCGHVGDAAAEHMGRSSA